MARRARRNVAFSLSFLDIMSCGFGAVVLVYLIMTHQSEVIAAGRAPAEDRTGGEVRLLTAEIDEAMQRLAMTADERAEQTAMITELQARLDRIAREISVDRQRANDSETAVAQDAVALDSLREEVSALRRETFAAPAAGAADDLAAATIRGEGQRLYVTGLRADGERVLILLDRSTSMLDDQLVNILRLRNLPAAQQQSARKWQRAIKTARWIGSQLPLDGEFQLYTFAEDVIASTPDTIGQWLRVAEGGVERALEPLTGIVPAGGTSLHDAFQAASALAPPPDSIFLITDGLPTRGAEPPRGGWISGRDRRRLFDAALEQLPPGVPVNVVLFPIDGDPGASVAFWQLAYRTEGALMSPARDWP